MGKIKGTDPIVKEAVQILLRDFEAMLHESTDHIVEQANASPTHEVAFAFKTNIDLGHKVAELKSAIEVAPKIQKHRDKRQSTSEDPDQGQLPLGENLGKPASSGNAESVVKSSSAVAPKDTPPARKSDPEDPFAEDTGESTDNPPPADDPEPEETKEALAPKRRCRPPGVPNKKKEE